MTDFRGVSVPPYLDPQSKVFMEKILEYLSRTDRGASGSSGSLFGGRSTARAAPGNVILRTISTSSQITSIPIEQEGTILQLRFTSSPTVVSSGNIRLVTDYTPRGLNERLTLISNGSEWWEVSRGSAGAQTFIPAALFGAIPDTGEDVTTEVQTALEDCPEGWTLFFSPGTYICSSNLSCAIPINIYAYGAVFDFTDSWDAKTSVSYPTLPTTLDDADDGDAAFTFGYAPASGTTTSINLSLSGLRVIRTAASEAPTDYKGAGIRLLSTYQCHYQDLSVSGFNVGFWLSGSVNAGYERGFAYNRLVNLNASSVAFGIYLDPGMADGVNSGWCNENSFFGGRISLAPTVQASANGCCAVYVRFTATDTHECNNNVFEHLSLEGQSGSGTYWGHKIYCQGRYNAWVWCRYEDPSGRAVPHAVADITFINAGGGGGTNNVLFYGFDLYKQNVTGDGSGLFNHIYSQTGVDFDRNHTITGRHLLLGNTASGLYSQSIILGNGDTPGLTLVNTTGSTKNALAIKAANETDLRLTLRESAEGSLYVGSMVGYTGTGAGTERNWIGLRNASPYYWGIYRGLRINVEDSTLGDVVWIDGAGGAATGFKLNSTTQRTEVGSPSIASTDPLLVTTGITTTGMLNVGTEALATTTSASAAKTYAGLTAGSLTITLPAVASVTDGHILILKDESGSGGHTIDGNASETIDGALTQPLGVYQSMTLVKRNSAWWIV